MWACPVAARPCFSFKNTPFCIGSPLSFPFIHLVLPPPCLLYLRANNQSLPRTWATTSQRLGQTEESSCLATPRRETNSSYCGDTWDNAIRGDKEVYYYFDVFLVHGTCSHLSHMSPFLGGWSEFPSQWTHPLRNIWLRAGHPVSWREHSDTFADSGVCVESVASGTFALEASKGVDAHSPLAQAWQLLTLVDVCRKQRVRRKLLCMHVVVL